MSLILRGVNLPEDKTIIIHYANKYGEMETVFVDKSDIIQIPFPHGRIIDIGTYKESSNMGEMLDKVCYNYCDSFGECQDVKYTK